MNITLNVIVLIVLVHRASCLRILGLIFPKSVPDGGNATLVCPYDLEAEPLYSVKWYRGTYEIFRYIPREKPSIRVFHLPGLYIDINSSNSRRLILLSVPKHLGGNFTCEVSADEPNYTTRFVTEFLLVTPRNITIDTPNESYTRLSVNNVQDLKLNATSTSNIFYNNYIVIIVVYSSLNIFK